MGLWEIKIYIVICFIKSSTICYVLYVLLIGFVGSDEKYSQTKKECIKLKKENDKLKKELKGLDLVRELSYF